MNSLQKDFLHALRSGDFLQTTGTMRDTDSDGKDRFCAVGLLFYVAEGNAELGGLAARRVSEEAGLREEAGDIRTIMRWNDSEGVTFMQLSDRLESYWTQVGKPLEAYSELRRRSPRGYVYPKITPIQTFKWVKFDTPVLTAESLKAAHAKVMALSADLTEQGVEHSVSVEVEEKVEEKELVPAF